MGLKINYNVSAMVANNALKMSDNKLSASLERLSSGYKINHAKDNAAGLAIARRMNAQIRGLSVAEQDAKDGESVIEIADGALAEVHDILQRMSELSVKASNGTSGD
ncbi:MAG: flagellin FliC3, partial [Lachnospiraceae bacterium]|nr:flagellin FliC3 [Lachnospiraceae bacterium]